MVNDETVKDEYRFSITTETFICRALGVIYAMAPYNKPRKVDEIVDHIREYFQTHGKPVFDLFIIGLNDKSQRYDLVEKILLSCNAFKELNLSQEEYDAGVGVNAEGRGQYAVIGRGITIDEYRDFIDIDACVRNISDELYWDWLDRALVDGDVDIVYYNGEDRP